MAVSELHPKEEINSPETHEAEILAAIHETLNNNKEAFRVIVNQYSPLIFSLSMRMLGNKEDAEEAVQEVFIKIYSSLHRFRIGKRVLPWMYTIALNHLRTQYRNRKRRKKVEGEYQREQQLNEEVQTKLLDPLQKIVLQEKETALMTALADLRQEYREVFVLRVIEELSVKDVSDILHIPEGTVKTYLHRAKTKLLTQIKKKNETKKKSGRIL